jgi:hypothetical protein
MAGCCLANAARGNCSGSALFAGRRRAPGWHLVLLGDRAGGSSIKSGNGAYVS